MTRADVFNWGTRFLWRTLSRMLLQFFRTMVGIPWLVIRIQPWRGRAVKALGSTLGALLGVVVGLVLFVALTGVLVVLGLILSVILALLSPLLLIPFVKKRIQFVVDALVDFVGDVATYREKPLRAAAMRVAFAEALDRARELVGDGDGEINVLAHSQGATISVKALFQDLDLTTIPVKRLFTVGATIALLGTTAWSPTPEKESYKPVKNWETHAPGIDWINFWAIWDPFAAGPVGDSFSARYRRWKACYGYEGHSPSTDGNPEDPPYFPAERAVHNTSLPFTDHQSYASNVLQVIDPIAKELLGWHAPPETETSESASADSTPAAVTRRVVRTRRARGLTVIASIVIAILVPPTELFTRIVGAALDWAEARANQGLAWLALGGSVDLGQAILPDGKRLSTLAFVVFAGLIAASLIWLSGAVSKRAERSLVWDRRPGTMPRSWIRIAFVLEALLIGCAAALTASAVDGFLLDIPDVVLAVATTVALLLILSSAHGGRLPQPAPANRPPRPLAATTSGSLSAREGAVKRAFGAAKARLTRRVGSYPWRRRRCP